MRNKPRTDMTYSREDLPEHYLLTRGSSFRTKQETEANRRYVTEVLKRSEDELNHEHL